MKIDIHKRSDKYWIILLSLIVLLPNIYLVCVGTYLTEYHFQRTFLYLMLSLILFVIPSLFLKARSFFIFEGVFVILAPLEIGHIYFTKAVTSANFLLTFFETDERETFELLSMLKFFIPIVLIIWFIYFFIVFKKINNTYLIPNKKLRLYLLGSIIAFLVFLFTYSYMVSRKKYTEDKSLIMSNTVDTVKWKFENVYPYDLLATFWKTHNIRKTVRQQREKVKNFVFHAEKIDTTDTREIYVFVIGESARYDNFSINGYEKDTSPLLEKTNNLISYSDYYSGANATMNSVPLMLTRSTPQTFEISQEEKTFVDAFKEAGFKTYWLGNQCGGSEYIRRISKDADGEYFNSGGENSILYDETLWPYFRKILNKNENKVLIVLHTLGSHFRYELRHPPRFKVFTPSYEGALDRSELIPKNRQKLMNTYDNSILYTDYFLANTINMIDSLKAISSLIYVSDHGENFFDTDENLFIHANLRYSKYDVHVPLFVWCSDQYIKNWGEKYEMMKQNKDKKISQANMFYSVLDIANITFPGQRLDKSFASGSLVEDSVRYIYKIDNTVEKLNF